MYDNAIEYIEDYGQLNEICKNIKKTNIIGIDTEFIRKYTYYPILCLIQVIYFDKNINTYKIAVIDTIKIQKLEFSQVAFRPSNPSNYAQIDEDDLLSLISQGIDEELKKYFFLVAKI